MSDTSPDIPQSELPPPENTPAPKRRGGFFPLVLGGVVAAGLGAAGATYVIPQLPEGWVPRPVSPEVADLQTQLSALTQQVAALSEAPPPGPDAATLDRIAALESALRDAKGQSDQAAAAQAAADATAAATAALAARVTEIEKRPVAGGAASALAIEAFQRELDALRAEVASGAGAADTSAVEAAAKAAEERIAAAAAETRRLADEAEATAKAAQIRASLSHLQAALESGSPIAAPLADLTASGIEVPEALATQAEGIPSVAALRAAWPEAARAALTASITETVGDGALDRIGAFLQVQTGARSIEPRAGDDPDAILSRAEAAVAAGRIDTALAEIATLPEGGQAALADWVALANRRLAAADAIAALAAQN